MEIIKRTKKHTTWRGKDAEGRRCYALTRNRGTIPVEPSGCQAYAKKYLTKG